MEELQELAALARTGDADAAFQLRQRLEEPMTRIIRRAMRSRSAASPLHERIRLEAHRFSPADVKATASKREGAVRRVAQRLCDSVIGNLRPVFDTAACCLHETVRV